MRRFFLPRTAPSKESNAEDLQESSLKPTSAPSLISAPQGSVDCASSDNVERACQSSNLSIGSESNGKHNWTAVVPEYDSILLEEDISVAKDPSDRLASWTVHNGMMCRFRTPNSTKYSRVIAFDLDHTIIVPKSNGRFAQSSDDWKFWHSEVPRSIALLFAEGFGIVFLSNQQGLGGSQKQKVPEFRRKVDAVIDALGVPVDFICSIDDNRFRKPLPGMWEFYRYARGGNEMSVAYVGDAAGRPHCGTRAKDFSDTDLKFARNLGIPVRVLSVVSSLL